MVQAAVYLTIFKENNSCIKNKYCVIFDSIEYYPHICISKTRDESHKPMSNG